MTAFEILEIPEQKSAEYDQTLMELLLLDQTARRNILWATETYADRGAGFGPEDELTEAKLTAGGRETVLPGYIRRAAFPERTIECGPGVDAIDAFCSLEDERWFGRSDVFTVLSEETDGRMPSSGKIEFPKHCRRGWREYVYAKRLISDCGEGALLTNRYDALTGARVPVPERIGVLDRKLRAIHENTPDESEWRYWAKRAVQSCYGYEFRGDRLLLARMNLLAAVAESYRARFGGLPELNWLKLLAKTISWNLWQMDGGKGVVPYSCSPVIEEEQEAAQPEQLSLFPEELWESEPETAPQLQLTECPGCRKNDIRLHTGTYCMLRNWTARGTKTADPLSRRNLRYIDLLEAKTTDGEPDLHE